jgi:hypothetical protein
MFVRTQSGARAANDAELIFVIMGDFILCFESNGGARNDL